MNWAKPVKFKTIPWVIVVILLLLIGLRVALPTIVENYVNKTLNRIPDYKGRVGGVEIWLVRGAYKIKDFDLKKINARVPVPFVHIEEADLSVEWGALFEGKLVGEIIFSHPQLNFTASSSERNEQLEIDSEWLLAVKDLFPLHINRFLVENGEIHFRNFESDPKVDLKLTKVRVLGTNFSNTRTPTKGPLAKIDAEALAENKAAVKVTSTLDLAKPNPTFDLDAEMEKFPIVAINDFLKAYLNIDATEGNLSIYTEIKASGGRIEGYVKPLVRDLSILSWKQDSDNPLTLVWQTIAATVAEIFTNHHKDQIGASVPFSGRLDKPKTKTWRTISSIFGNAFIRSLKPGLENIIDFNRPKNEQ